MKTKKTFKLASLSFIIVFVMCTIMDFILRGVDVGFFKNLILGAISFGIFYFLVWADKVLN